MLRDPIEELMRVWFLGWVISALVLLVVFFWRC